jgi:Zn-dependent metalloprotease
MEKAQDSTAFAAASDAAKERQASSRNLYADAETSLRNGEKKTAAALKPTHHAYAPGAYSVLPPYLLKEMARRNPGDAGLKRAYNEAVEMEEKPSFLQAHGEAAPHGEREIYDAQSKYDQPGQKARFENEPATGNDEVDKAYDYSGIIREFYQKEFGRNSIDGQGMKFISTVNYGGNYQNAYWDGSQMIYGHQGAKSPFRSFVLLDLCGHEITHGVTEKESDLDYHGQAGSLNESISDVFGELIKQYAKKQTAEEADWLVGDGIWKEGIHGRGVRDMLNPGTAYDDPKLGKDPQPADMKHFKTTFDDEGGVHINSGIPNRAFALFARSVGGYAWKDPGHIWFAARKAAGSFPHFADFAYQTIKQAKLTGNQDEVEKLKKAWETVGVTPTSPQDK